MDQGDIIGYIHMGMRIAVTRIAVGRPSGVSDTDLPSNKNRPRYIHKLFEVADAALLFEHM